MTTGTAGTTSTSLQLRHARRRQQLVAELTASRRLGPDLERTTRLAARVADYPLAQVNVLDDRLQHTLAEFDGLRPRPARAADMVRPRESSFCERVVTTGAPVAVNDLRRDAEYAAMSAVREGHALSYLGVPVRSRDDVVGSLCVIDARPRQITCEQVHTMTEFAALVEDRLELARRDAEAARSDAAGNDGLLRAIESGQIVPWYQPIVDLDTGRPTSFEALARRVRPSGEVEGPARFMAGAEACGQVVDLDLAIMRAALRDLERWQRDRDVSVNINLSPLHLEMPGGVAEILAVAAESSVDPATVTLELTESRRIDDLHGAAAAVAELRAAGFPVVLDDFGTGWSTLDWIMTLPVTGLKIDGSVAPVLDQRVGAAVTRAATGLAADLDLSLILEGISTAARATAAREHGYRFGQGYFWSPPVPAFTVDGWAAAARPPIRLVD